MFDLLIKVLRRLRLLRYLVVYPRRTVAGRRVKIPMYLDAGFRNLEDLEPWMVGVLGPLMAGSKGLFVDVGEHVGQTLLKVRGIDPLQPYLGFEPNPSCLGYIEELIRVNRMADVRIVPGGLSDGDRLTGWPFTTLMRPMTWPRSCLSSGPDFAYSDG